MKQKSLSDLSSQLEKTLGPAAAIASALAVPWALASTGDLDPVFGTVGRLAPIPDREGSARSLDMLADGSAIVAGGHLEILCNFYCYYDETYVFNATSFIDRVTADGAIDPNFDAAVLENTEVFDAVMQPDNKLVAVGREVSVFDFDPQLVVFRLLSDGALDPTFGTGGTTVLPTPIFARAMEAHAVTLDAENRIVVAGERDGELLVVRFLSNGSLDSSFGTDGAFYDPATEIDGGWRVVSVAGGGYRVMTGGSKPCSIVALTEDGTLDTAFGVAGILSLDSVPGGGGGCGSLALASDGRLLASGASGAAGGFVVRLLANGVIDGSFVADPAIAASFFEVSAIQETDEKIILAGRGIDGATIMRLQANGDLDSQFGQSGQSVVDLPTEHPVTPFFAEVAMDSDGVVVAAGNYQSNPDRPFFIKLIGDAGGDGPGVLSVFSESEVPVQEQAGDVAIDIRRTGGSDGQVSVAYATSAVGSATSGEDFEAVSGVLTWSDGDTDAQQVVVPIFTDSGPPEEFENFRLSLSDTQGGAGIGARSTLVIIQPDGAPAGQFAIYESSPGSESDVALLRVTRNFYFEGAVSVTVMPVSGTAVAGEDFTATPVTLTWGDQESAEKWVQIPIVDDTRDEGAETFTVQLSSPTGGAIVGPKASVTFTIRASDQTRPAPSQGGGGASGLLSILLLGLTGLFQKVCAKRRASLVRTAVP